MTTIELLKTHIASIRTGLATHAQGLTIIPLFGPHKGPRTISLPEALALGVAEVTEVSEAGQVNALQVTNRADRPLLLLDGEELVGAKQNRLVNVTILVAVGAVERIPVSCIEMGRWRSVSPAFSSRQRVVPSTMRRSKASRMSDNLRTTGRHDADQGAVWADVEMFSVRAGVRSRTGALSDALDAHAEELDRFTTDLPLHEDQIGMAAMIDGIVVGIDVMGHPTAYAAAHHRLVHSYASEAMQSSSWRKPSNGTEPETSDLGELLSQALQGDWSGHPSPGLGTSIRVETERSTTMALCLDDDPIHVAIFAHGGDLR
jgi:hypothetical protein